MEIITTNANIAGNSSISAAILWQVVRGCGTHLDAVLPDMGLASSSGSLNAGDVASAFTSCKLAHIITTTPRN